MLLSFTFTPIAEAGSASPYSRLDVGQAINDRGQVAFVATLTSGGQAVYRTEADGRLTTIAQTDNLIKDFYLSPYMNDSGTVSFGADLTDGRQAIFTGDGGALTRIADSEPDSPFSSLPAPAPRIDTDGTVVFQAPLRSGGKGFFTGDGEQITTLYVTGAEFSAFPGSPASQVHGDEVAFRATLTGGPAGVFRGDGLHTDTIVTAGATYSSFLASEINDEGTVGINANLTAGGQAIVMAKDGTLTTFVDTSGPFLRFPEGKFSISNQPGAVFGADLKTGGTGIFDGPDPAVDKVLATGDELFGSTVVGFPANYLNPRGLNNAAQIVFRVNLLDGRTVLVRADPDGDGQDELSGEGHDNADGPQGENATLAPSLPPAGLAGSSAPAASTSSPPAFASSSWETQYLLFNVLTSVSGPLVTPPLLLQGEGWGQVASGFVPTPAAVTPATVEHLDQFFAVGMEDETSFTLPKSGRDPLSFADDLGVDGPSWE